MPEIPTHPDIDLVAGTFYAGDSTAQYDWMRANAPVYFDERNGVWGISKHADVKRISKRPDLFSNAGGIRPDAPPMPQMIDMDDPEHWRRRKLVNRGFTPRRVRDSEEKIGRVRDEIIDGIADRGECDFVRDIAAWLPMVMIGDMLGVAPEDRSDLLRWSDELLSALDGSGSEESAEKAAKTFGDYVDYITPVIADRKEHPTEDLIGVIVNAVVDGDRLDDEELIFESLLILVGGDETTRHVITGGMYQLLRHPEQRAALSDNPDLMDSAVEEMLRWVSPIKNMARTVTEDVEFGGQELKEGQKLLVLYESANRDEDVFVNPHTFDIERSPNEHVAFGFGPHFCLGNSLARLEIKVMVERLLTRMPDLELVDDTEPPKRVSNFISGYETMPVRWTEVRPATV